MHAVTFLAVAAVALRSVAALGTNYEHDGNTTYCWSIPRPTDMTKLTEDDRVNGLSGIACPMELSVDLNATTVAVFEAVSVKWTLAAQLTDDNELGQTELSYGKDAKGVVAQIVHSNVHSCVFGTGCDPFNDGKELVDKTVNKVTNFTNSEADFVDVLRFTQPGEYSVLAHIILPSDNASARFDYAVYTKVLVTEASEAETPAPAANVTESPAPTEAENDSSGGGGLSTGATVGIIVGAVVAILVVIGGIIYLRRRRSDSGSSGYVPAPTTDTNADKKLDATISMTNTSAWGGSIERPTVDLDGTNHSAGSYGGYSAAQSQNQSRGSGPTDEYAASSAARKKRVESDVEL
ncbi:hypothetical protein Poli38472_009422 [Pythium oligandrum]|uniref:Uncharacterized protein n=1 Tax=Pythium oligandrum TaxID=41045 RepID=A0A8K1CMC2_PYTOL|nr:hypothetical protein Poli38472_009422 [Pythium oligandrum]|eukprot:TMW65255.1 hypothetical protein Poli38472_009422 [Pythium oligandrum]